EPEAPAVVAAQPEPAVVPALPVAPAAPPRRPEPLSLVPSGPSLLGGAEASDSLGAMQWDLVLTPSAPPPAAEPPPMAEELPQPEPAAQETTAEAAAQELAPPAQDAVAASAAPELLEPPPAPDAQPAPPDDSAEAPPEPAAPVLDILLTPEPPEGADAPREPEPEYRSPPGMLLVEEVLARATDREKIAEALTWFAEGRFSTFLLFVVRGGLAGGWAGIGPGIDRARLDKLLVPLDQPSILTAAVDARDTVLRQLPETALDRRFLAHLGLHPRSSAVAFPIFARDRLVNIAFGTRGSWPMRDNTADEVRRVATSVSKAYDRLILLRKRIDE
ncbi:MAG: hypothetical protein ACK4N5_09370, partial [Myxococcales bacterium]